MDKSNWSDLKRQRYKDINWVVEEYGIQLSDKYIISIRDLAWSLNNTWKAGNFVTDKSIGEQTKHGFVVEGFNLHEMYNAIKHGAKGSDVEFKEAENGTWYFVKEIA